MTDLFFLSHASCTATEFTHLQSAKGIVIQRNHSAQEEASDCVVFLGNLWNRHSNLHVTIATLINIHTVYKYVTIATMINIKLTSAVPMCLATNG